MRFKIGISKTGNLETRIKSFDSSHPNGSLKLKIAIKHSFIEKPMMYLLKKHLMFLNTDTYDGSLEDIALILGIIVKLEDILINNDTNNINKILQQEQIDMDTLTHDPEIPFVKKGKRSVDQIDKDSGKILATFPSIEAAGKALGLTTGSAIGIALRNKSLSQGYCWRYSGFSIEDLNTNQPVIRFNCKTGEQTLYPNIASAAKAARVSPPGLRNRILTDVHIHNFHWVFDKTQASLRSCSLRSLL
jgi:hypothetical protein